MLEGLRVAPVIPSAWEVFEAVRSYRGVRYEISVKREGTGNEVTLTVDGKPIEGTIIPLPGNEVKTVKVKVILR